MDGVLVFAFIGGAVATVNPCGFALLPAYLARRIHVANTDSVSNTIIRAIAVGAITTSGFLMVFGLAGFALSFGAYWLMKYMPWAGFAIGIILFFTGIYILTGRKLNIRFPVLATRIAPHSWTGDLLFGVGYGTASLSCTLPIFLSVTGSAFTGSLSSSILTFVAYALGMGTVLMALAIAAALTRLGLATRIKKAGIYVNRFSGGVLLLSGTYITFYWGIALFSPGIPSASGLIANGEIISGTMRAWLGSSTGQMVMMSIALLITSFLLWMSCVRFTRKTDRKKSI